MTIKESNINSNKVFYLITWKIVNIFSKRKGIVNYYDFKVLLFFYEIIELNKRQKSFFDIHMKTNSW